MFTGLVEEIGLLKRSYKQGEAMMLTIEASKVLEDSAIGDSISVNGVCLTITELLGGAFTVDVMPQTFRHSNLKDIRPGEKVNLERAMLAGGRFGGHIVQGHADGTGVIVKRTPEANAVVFAIRPHDPSLLRYIVPQGSITLDGISLTVVSVDQGGFSVSIIPHTLRETALQLKQPGGVINIECDVIGKYVDHLLHYKGERPAGGEPVSGGESGGSKAQAGAGMRQTGVTAAFLAENGFI